MIGFIVFGLVVGALARLLIPGDQGLSILATLLLGLAGSVVGGIVASLIGTGNIWELDLIGALVAIAAAAAFIAVGQGAASRRA